MHTRNWAITVVVGLGLASLATRAPAQNVFSAVGQNAIDIQTGLDAFRADLGPIQAGPSTGLGPNNRREVNWDGVPDAFSSGGANAFPGDFFNLATGNAAGRIRGIQFTTSGTFEVSADSDSDGDGNPGPVETLFANRHPDNDEDFAAFSAERIFGLNGTNLLDVTFSLPGSPDVAALVRGFGAVFTDVEEDGTTKLEFFDLDDNLLATENVPAFPLDGAADTFKSFSFLGLSFDDAVVSRIRITNGSLDLSLVSFGAGNDAVAMDDFIYGEPIAVPEPGTIGLLLVGGAVLTVARRRRAL
ncbi:MAG: PEP-CTERM sorting domain-containing protein [Planctomycetia bacterium]|nr:PEP-CTERM sorting domain-containing protein [Planctomycetia bacterium]